MSQYIERRAILHSSLSKDIAQHLFARQLPGGVLIVTERPDIVLSSVRKQWIKILRTIQKERASTLIATRIQELNYQSMYMQRLPMSIVLPDSVQENGVFFITPASLGQIPKAVHTTYVTTRLQDAQLEILQAKMPPDSLIVLY